MMPSSHADDIRADARHHRDQQAGGNFDRSHDEHEGVRRNEIRDRRSEVLFPVRQKTEELVRTRNDRRDDEPDIERQIGLIAGCDTLSKGILTLTTGEPGRMAMWAYPAGATGLFPFRFSFGPVPSHACGHPPARGG